MFRIPHIYSGAQVRPWKDADGKWYVGVSTDGCNATTRNMPCGAGGQLDLYVSDALRGPRATWKHVGPMFTSNRTALTGHGDANFQPREFITPEFFGSIPGDESGTLRVLTNNDGPSSTIRVPLLAARTLNATDQSRVTLSLR